MARFPAPGHLVSWAKFAPTARQSAGKSKPGSTGKSNPWLGGALGEAVIGAARTKTFLGARYHRLARRRGQPRAPVAVGNSIPTIAHRLLSDPAARFSDLGSDWHDRIVPVRRKRQLIAELERHRHPPPRRQALPHRHRPHPRSNPRPAASPRPGHPHHQRRHRRTTPPAHPRPRPQVPAHPAPNRTHARHPRQHKHPHLIVSSGCPRCLETSQWCPGWDSNPH
jgi:hypothetical protein